MYDEWLRNNLFWIKPVLIISPILLVLYVLLKTFYENRSLKKEVNKVRKESGNKFYDSMRESVEHFVDASPAHPIRFGSKIEWLVIKTVNHDKIADLFTGPPKKVFRTNMLNGIYGAYASHIFILPPINGWTIVVNNPLRLTDKQERCQLEDLSKEFNEVQVYGCHRGNGYYSWAKLENGIINRAFCIADGEIYLNEGDPTDLEQQFIEEACANATDEEERNWLRGPEKYLSMAGEEKLFKIAGHWSINPDTIDQYAITELGTIIG